LIITDATAAVTTDDATSAAVADNAIISDDATSAVVAQDNNAKLAGGADRE